MVAYQAIMAEDMCESVETILQRLARHINGLGEQSRMTRRRAIEGINKELFQRKPALEKSLVQGVLKELIKPILKLSSDTVEKCRELSITLLLSALEGCSEPNEFLSYVIPFLVQRIGQQDIIEQSEEMRLQLVQLLKYLIEVSNKNIGVYVDDCVKILQRTIVDPYPEVKKESCNCASILAKTVPEHFHMQSESLIKPLLQTLSHQHSRVRVTAVHAIGRK